MAKKINVLLGDRSYPVVIDHNTLGQVRKFTKGKQVVIISDPLVYRLYGSRLTANGSRLILIPRGEKNKSLKSAEKIWNKLAGWKISRDAVIIALGGGVIGDLSGFIASTYMRGAHLIQVPTTLLSQVDASIGGKTGVNHPCCKNMIGTFYQPDLVLIDVNTLKTLPKAEIKNGMAEIVKYGIIKSPRIFNILENNAKLTPELWEELIEQCVKAKAEVVEQDEREVLGGRMILNFGHTIGHAIESLTGYKKMSHGEAVAVGMIAASEIAYKIGLTTPEVLERIWKVIKSLNLPTFVKGIPPQKILNAMKMDKKVRNGKIKLVLPVRIGAVAIKDDVDPKIILESLKEFVCK